MKQDFRRMKDARNISYMIYYYMERNPSGGYCRSVLSEGKINDDDILFCLKECAQNNDMDGLKIIALMLSIKKSERLLAIDLAEEFLRNEKA